MSEYEQHLILIEYMAIANQFTEFWLAISFAVVVAATYAPASLGKFYYRLMAIGYISASITLMFNRAAITSAMHSRATNMIESGFTPDVDSLFGGFGTVGIWLLMTVGTVFVVLYVRSVASKYDNESA